MRTDAQVVTDQRGFAMYFSRASIPYDREGFKTKPVEKIQDCFLRHVGIYGYRAGFISKYIGCVLCVSGSSRACCCCAPTRALLSAVSQRKLDRPLGDIAQSSSTIRCTLR